MDRKDFDKMTHSLKYEMISGQRVGTLDISVEKAREIIDLLKLPRLYENHPNLKGLEIYQDGISGTEDRVIAVAIFLDRGFASLSHQIPMGQMW